MSDTNNTTNYQNITKINISDNETFSDRNNQIDTTGRINEKLFKKFNKNDIIKLNQTEEKEEDNKVYSKLKTEDLFLHKEQNDEIELFQIITNNSTEKKLFQKVISYNINSKNYYYLFKKNEGYLLQYTLYKAYENDDKTISIDTSITPKIIYIYDFTFTYYIYDNKLIISSFDVQQTITTYLYIIDLTEDEDDKLYVPSSIITYKIMSYTTINEELYILMYDYDNNPTIYSYKVNSITLNNNETFEFDLAEPINLLYLYNAYSLKGNEEEDYTKFVNQYKYSLTYIGNMIYYIKLIEINNNQKIGKLCKIPIDENIIEEIEILTFDKNISFINAMKYENERLYCIVDVDLEEESSTDLYICYNINTTEPTEPPEMTYYNIDGFSMSSHYCNLYINHQFVSLISLYDGYINYFEIPEISNIIRMLEYKLNDGIRFDDYLNTSIILTDSNTIYKFSISDTYYNISGDKTNFNNKLIIYDDRVNITSYPSSKFDAVNKLYVDNKLNNVSTLNMPILPNDNENY